MGVLKLFVDHPGLNSWRYICLCLSSALCLLSAGFKGVHDQPGWSFSFFNLFYFQLCVCTCVYVCMWMQAPSETKRARQTLCSRCHRQLWATWCGCWEPNWSSARATNGLNYKAVSWSLFFLPFLMDLFKMKHAISNISGPTLGWLAYLHQLSAQTDGGHASLQCSTCPFAAFHSPLPQEDRAGSRPCGHQLSSSLLGALSHRSQHSSVHLVRFLSSGPRWSVKPIVFVPSPIAAHCFSERSGARRMVLAVGA